MILELIIMPSKICCNLQVLPWMETKCGNQTLHGMCYLCPSQDVLEQQTTETANYSVLMELIIFLHVSVSLHASYCCCSFSGSRQAQSGGGYVEFM